ncbi:MAG TPA: hypothetical protein VGX23_34290 [Actinocrinis sp.]|nr:hypothetical protein [Actinocrinis sp.]
MSGTLIGMAVVAAVFLVFALGSWVRGRAGRSFKAEFDRLVRATPIDWYALRGPGPTPQSVLGRDASNLHPKPLAAADRVLYTSSWQQVKTEFAESPAGALQTAEHLTADLLMTRGLVPAGTLRPAVLPQSWSFHTAQGYRQAQRISARTSARASRLPGTDVPPAEMATAMALFEAFFQEMLTISATESSDT